MLKKLGNMPWVQTAAAFLSYLIIVLVCRSNRLTVRGLENVRELQKSGGILLLWHQSLLMPIFSCRNMGLAPIIASSRDGELIARFVRKLGYEPVRGSSGKADGPAALMACLRLVRRQRVIPITPDGPTGPLYTVHKGAIAILRKTGCAFTACGCAMSRPVVLNGAWDKHRLPRLFDKSAVYYSPLTVLPENVTDEEAARIIIDAIHEANRHAEEMLNE